MSVEALAIGLHHSRAKGANKLVLLGIANHDGDGGSWPSVATLGVYAGCSDRNVQRGIAELERLGEIERRISAGGTHRTPATMRPNLYLFTLKCPPTCDRTTAHRLLCSECSKPLPPSRRMHAAHELCTGVTPTSPGDAHVTGGVTWASPEPSTNQTIDIDALDRSVLNREAAEGYTSTTAADAHASRAARAAREACAAVSSGRHFFDPITGWCHRCGEARS